MSRRSCATSRSTTRAPKKKPPMTWGRCTGGTRAGGLGGHGDRAARVEHNRRPPYKKLDASGPTRRRSRVFARSIPSGPLAVDARKEIGSPLDHWLRYCAAQTHRAHAHVTCCIFQGFPAVPFGTSTAIPHDMTSLPTACRGAGVGIALGESCCGEAGEHGFLGSVGE